MGSKAESPVERIPDPVQPAARVLEATGVAKSFGGQSVLRSVSFTLRQGQVVVLRGENGSGKTTLLNVLSGGLAPDAGALEYFAAPQRPGRGELARSRRQPSLSWRVGFGTEKTSLRQTLRGFQPEAVAGRGIGRTWQDLRLFRSLDSSANLEVAIPERRAERLAFALWTSLARTLAARENEESRSRSSARLRQLSLADKGTSLPDTLSLGQARRLSIGRAAENEARILLLDEPLAGLDASAVHSVLDLLRDLKQRGVAMIIVEHALNHQALSSLVDAVWTLSDGSLRLDSSQHLRSNTTKSRSLVSSLLGPAFVCKSSTKLAQGAVLHTYRPLRHGVEEAPILEVCDLVVYRGRRLIVGEADASGSIRGLSFSLQRGEIAVLEAPNGWGKTTLLDSLAGLAECRQGRILVDGVEMQTRPAWVRGREAFSYVRSRDNVYPSLRSREVLALRGITPESTQLQGILAKRMSDLSGGERQRLALVCGLRSGRRVRLLDEPWFSLDTNGLGALANQLGASDAATVIAVPQREQGD